MVAVDRRYQNADQWTTLDQPSVTSLTSSRAPASRRALQSVSRRLVERHRSTPWTSSMDHYQLQYQTEHNSTPSPARTKPLASPSAPTSARPRTSSALRTMARRGRSRAHPPTQSISLGFRARPPKTASRWETPATSGRAPRSWARRRGSGLGGENPPSGTSRAEFRFVSEHRRLLCGRGELGARLCQRGVRMERAATTFRSRRASTPFRARPTSDCTAVGFGIFGSPVIIGTVDAGPTWTSETGPLGRRHPDRSLVRECRRRVMPSATFGSSAPSIIATSNGGASWASESFPGIVTNFTGISCPDSLALHRRGTVLRRTACGDPHHGRRWSQSGRRRRLPPGPPSSTASRAPATRLAWPPDPMSSARQTAAPPGTTWELPSGRPPWNPSAASARRPAPPWAAPDILTTTDGGTGWTSQAGPGRCRLPARGGVRQPRELRSSRDGNELRAAPSPPCRLRQVSPPPASPSAPSACRTQPR